MINNDNIASFNRLLIYVLGQAYGKFPCEIVIGMDDLLPLCDYECDPVLYNSGQPASRELFVDNTIRYLIKELKIIQGFEQDGFYQIRLSIKGYNKMQAQLKDKNLSALFVKYSNQIKEQGIKAVINKSTGLMVNKLFSLLETN